MKILWFNCKDKKNPLAGGAEQINEELAKRLVQEGHEVIFLTSNFSGGEKTETVDGYKIIRLGNRWTVYYLAFRYYKTNFQGWADLVIDEVNTMPFFCKYFVKEKNILFIHQLAREIWFYEMFWPFSYLGFWLEPLYLRLINDRTVITISNSTKNDLLKNGFKRENIEIISEGIEIEPAIVIDFNKKLAEPTILALGTIRAMKRTDEIIKAFELAKVERNDLRLIIAGKLEGRYGKKVFKMIQQSNFSDSICYLGKISIEKKIILLGQVHILCMTSVKEGWGLTVTEAASQGTLSIVYDVDGLRDSVKYGETGVICEKNNPKNLASNILKIIDNREEYQRIAAQAWNWSKQITFQRCYEDFKKKINVE